MLASLGVGYLKSFSRRFDVSAKREPSPVPCKVDAGEVSQSVKDRFPAGVRVVPMVRFGRLRLPYDQHRVFAMPNHPTHDQLRALKLDGMPSNTSARLVNTLCIQADLNCCGREPLNRTFG